MLRVLLAAVYLWSSVLGAVEYQAAADHASWNVEQTQLLCSMTHTIPGFGQFQIQQHAGKPVMLSLRAESARHGLGNAVLQAITQPWQPIKSPQLITEMPVQTGHDILSVGEPMVQKTIDALLEGKRILVSLPLEYPGEQDPTQLLVSSVDFQKAYGSYMDCQKQLISLSFRDLSKVQLYFESGTMRLTSESLRILEELLAYDEFEGPIRKIVVEGHTDSVGRFAANSRLSFERAWTVKDWLVMEGGFAPDKIEVKGMGSSQPIATNKTSDGRLKNRRVTLKVTR